MPKTAVEKGIGLPENISNLTGKCCPSPNLSAKLFEKIMYIKKVIITAIFALFSSLCALILNPSFVVSSIANPIIGIGNIGLKDSREIHISVLNNPRNINMKKTEDRAKYNFFDDISTEKLFFETIKL